MDDDALIQDLIVICFEDWPDAQVNCVSDGLQGARLLKERHFDLALIDGTLPGLSGIELAAIAADENTPALLISAHHRVNEKLERYGFRYLEKPVSLDQLLAESQEILSNPSGTIVRLRDSVTRMRLLDKFNPRP